jgi:hypothetical protein
MRERLRHHFNPLHIYCRLRQAGLHSRRAKRLCFLYEKLYCLFL